MEGDSATPATTTAQPGQTAGPSGVIPTAELTGQQQPSTPSEAGASGADGLTQVEQNEVVNDLIRSAVNRASTSKPADDATDAQSAPDRGDEAAPGPPRGADGRYVPRRGIPKAVEEAERRAAEAERRLSDLDPARLREQIRAEIQAEQQRTAEQQHLEQLAQTRQADVERYQQLLATPDHQLSVEDYQWREDWKEKLAAFPDVERFQTDRAERQIASAVDAHLGSVREAITASAQREGIDPARWTQPGTTWASMANDVADAREARVRAEVQPHLDRLAEAERELQQLRTQGLGLGRAPAGAGRSAAPGPLTENELMNDLIRRSVGIA